MKYVIWGLVAILLILAGFAVYAATGLPDVGYLAWENPATTAFAEQWKKAQERGGKSSHFRQEWVDFKDISPYLVGAVLVSEDINFWEHSGYDWEEIKRAIRTDIKKGRFARGASTITQQLARNLFLSGAKTPARKLREFFIARKLEKELSKMRILELYLNWVEWGEGVFGIQAASWNYFQNPAWELWPEEAVRLTAILPNPKRFSPFSDSPYLKRKRNLVLQRMLKYGMISDDDYEFAKKELEEGSS
ncbi:MAG TPA: monofunctional biosynthetic peptidoglycan transglycosylase [candidate division Zixibacteria bacterium]|nr:monofunctional biosynthetic peptidoglycan transglycosylase [candidate division Zixibacteria bacterium]